MDISTKKAVGTGLLLALGVCSFFPHIQAGIQAGFPVLGRTGNTLYFVNAASVPFTGGNCLQSDVNGNATEISGPCASGSGNVAAAGTLTNNEPVIGQGSTDVAVGTRSGNTTLFMTGTGSFPTGNCAEFDADGNIVDSGSSCGGGSGATISNPYISYSGAYYAPVFTIGARPGDVAGVAWRNQGAATETLTNGSAFLKVAGTGGDNWRIREIAIPSADYTATVLIRLFPSVTSAATAWQAGLCTVDSASGKLEAFVIGYTSVRFTVSDFTNVTTFSTIPFDPNNDVPSVMGPPYALQQVVSGGTISFQVSPDGINYVTVFSRSSTAFLAAPDKIGYCINTNDDSSHSMSATFYNFYVR